MPPREFFLSPRKISAGLSLSPRKKYYKKGLIGEGIIKAIMGPLLSDCNSQSALKT